MLRCNYMKRIFCLIFCLLLIISVSGCNKKPENVHEAHKGNINVDIDEPVSSAPVIIESPLLGKWTLVSIKKGASTTKYINSSYDFRDSGNLKVTLDKREDFMKYSISGNVITIVDGATISTVTYELVGDTLYLTTETGARQTLERMK